MKFALILATLIGTLHGISAFAEDVCLDQKRIDEVRAQIDLQTSDLDKFDRCQPTTNTYKILQALILVKTMTYAETSLAEPFSQHILSGDFWTYFAERASVIVDEGACKPGMLAFVYGFTKDGNVHVCDDLYLDRISKFERAETMLHEVRHFEGYGHITCDRGPRKGVAGACDGAIGEKGSYAVTVEVLTKMALNSHDIARPQKTMLKALALTYANEAFEEPVRSRDLSAFLAVGKDQRTYLYSDAGALEVASLSQAKIVSRAASLAVFPNDKSDVYTANVFSKDLEPGEAMGSFAQKYNALPVAQRPDVVDILNLDKVTCAVTSHEIWGSLTSVRTQSTVPVPWTIQGIFSAREYGVEDPLAVYVLKSDTEMYRLEFKEDQSYTLDPVPNRLGGMKQISVFNNQRLGLDASGRVQIENGSTWSVFAPLAFGKFQQITRPFLWDQYFEDAETQMVSL